MEWEDSSVIVPILNVGDVAASSSFYVDKLGFKLDMTMPGPNGGSIFAMVSLGKSTIGLDAMTPGAPRGGPGVDLMVFVPDDADIDQVYQAVRSRGTVIAQAIETKYWGDRVFSVFDPDGYRITISKTVQQVPIEQIEALMRGNIAQ